MQLKLTGNVPGNSPHAAAVEMPFQVRRRPARVLRFDQRNFLSSYPSFQLLLSIDCFPDIVKAFVVDQTSAIVLGRESFDFTSLVLEHPAINAVGHPEV